MSAVTEPSPFSRPYAKRGAVVSTQFNTTSILRTIEQILGLPPMNQFDAYVTPMFDCFQDKPDFSPFEAAASNIALDEHNPAIEAIDNSILRADAVVSSKINFRELPRGRKTCSIAFFGEAFAAARPPIQNGPLIFNRRTNTTTKTDNAACGLCLLPHHF